MSNHKKVGPPRPTQTFDYPECKVTTNLPVGFESMLGYCALGAREILLGSFVEDVEPDLLDDMEPGIYFMDSMRHDSTAVTERYQAEVVVTKYGKSITGFNGWYPSDAPDLAETLGFWVVNSEGEIVSALPSPQSLAKACAELGLDVKLMHNFGIIPAKEYLDVYARGEYPVATGEFYDYKHDIGFDHLPAMICGGKPLRDALKIAASCTPTGKDSEFTAVVDDFTFLLTQYISTGSVSRTNKDSARSSILLSGKKAEKTICRVARRLEIPNDDTDNIIKEARSNAVRLGVAPLTGKLAA